MSFEKFVQKSTKGLFVFIIIAMVLPLVLWGYMGDSSGDADPAKQVVVGTVYGSIEIKQGELDRMRSKAVVDWWWKQYALARETRRPPQPPKDEDLERLAWENIVLLQDARLKGVTATEPEINARYHELFTMLTGAQDIKGADDLLAPRVQQYFHTNLQAWDGWVSDHVLIEKLLNMVAGAGFASYDEVYSQITREQIVSRAWYAGFDPKSVEKKLRPSTADELARRYEQTKWKYKVPAKAQVTYLKVDLEGYKKALAEPAEAEVRKYYDDHRAEYVLPHEHAPGERHVEGEEPKYTPFEQAKKDIPDKIKTEKARESARELMAKVDRALGELYDKEKKEYPGSAFETLKAKFKESGAELVHDVLPKFAQRDADDLEASIGKGANVAAWAFEEKTKKGAVSRVMSTDKGVYLFRLIERIDGYETGVTERVRESLERETRKDQIRQRTNKAAADLAQAVAAKGMEAARRSHPADWGVTRYFKPRVAADTGIEDTALAQAVVAQAASLSAGKAAVLSGAQAGKPEWSYVVYLEDVVPAPPTEVESGFTMAKRELDEMTRRRLREEYPAKALLEAKIKKAGAVAAP